MRVYTAFCPVAPATLFAKYNAFFRPSTSFRFLRYAISSLFVVMPNHIHAIVYIDGEAIWGVKGGDAMNNGNIGDAMNRVSTGGDYRLE